MAVVDPTTRALLEKLANPPESVRRLHWDVQRHVTALAVAVIAIDDATAPAP